MPKQRGEDPDVLHRRGQTATLVGLATDEQDVFELMLVVKSYDVRGQCTPDLALLEVAATALGLACPPGNQPLEHERLTDRYLPDLMLRGRTLRHRTTYELQPSASRCPCPDCGQIADELGLQLTVGGQPSH